MEATVADQQRDFFISYTGADRAWAEWIAVQLEAAGHTTVLQAWDFRPGQDFLHEMPLRRRDLQPPYLCGDPGQRGLVDWWSAAVPRGGVVAPNRSRGHRWSARSTARTNDLGAGNGAAHAWPAREAQRRSAQAGHLLAWWW
jgi:hypothetical protein